MALEIEGKIVHKLTVVNGTSARGPWSKQEFVVEHQEGNFPNNVCFSVWGDDKVKDLEKFQVGDSVKVSFNINSREYNGKWYTDLRAWRVEAAGAAAPGGGAPGYGGAAAPGYGAPGASAQGYAPGAGAARYGQTGVAQGYAPAGTASAGWFAPSDGAAPAAQNEFNSSFGEDDLPF